MFSTVQEAIRRAREEVLFAAFALADDTVGRPLVDALCDAARRGVRVAVILDGLGSRHSLAGVQRRLRAAGVPLTIFRPFRTWLLLHPLAALCRIHARLLVVDRALVGLGGIVFRSEFGDRPDLFLLHQAECPNVAVDIFHQFKILASSPYSGALHPSGAMAEGLSLLLSSPEAQDQEIYRWMLSACRAAEKRIRIATPIFFPPHELVTELRGAADRGVDVRIVTPLRKGERKDVLRGMPLPSLVAASGVQWYGSRLYFHAKFCIFDDRWTMGSANFDVLGMKRNFELNVQAEGGPIMDELESFFSMLTSSSSRITADHAFPIARAIHPVYRTAEFLSALV